MSCEKEIPYTGDVIAYWEEISKRHDPHLEIALKHREKTLTKRKTVNNQTGSDFETETGENNPFPARVQKLIDAGWQFRKGTDEPSVLISPDGNSQFTVKEDGNLYDHEA
ncbi:hypothetical protein HY382_00245 [Candidatus Curtissbacteria bacterium]|nr:hypothetical protein [Candidatus Curtissbacteria bacterium]